MSGSVSTSGAFSSKGGFGQETDGQTTNGSKVDSQTNMFRVVAAVVVVVFIILIYVSIHSWGDDYKAVLKGGWHEMSALGPLKLEPLSATVNAGTIIANAVDTSNVTHPLPQQADVSDIFVPTGGSVSGYMNPTGPQTGNIRDSAFLKAVADPASIYVTVIICVVGLVWLSTLVKRSGLWKSTGTSIGGGKASVHMSIKAFDVLALLALISFAVALLLPVMSIWPFRAMMVVFAVAFMFTFLASAVMTYALYTGLHMPNGTGDGSNPFSRSVMGIAVALVSFVGAIMAFVLQSYLAKPSTNSSPAYLTASRVADPHNTRYASA